MNKKRWAANCIKQGEEREGHMFSVQCFHGVDIPIPGDVRQL